jgi:hypothetical protein
MEHPKAKQQNHGWYPEVDVGEDRRDNGWSFSSIQGLAHSA